MKPPRSLDIGSHHLGDAVSELRIVLNGEPQRRVLAYDVDAGFIRKVASDGRGNILVVDGDVVETLERGDVRVGWGSRMRLCQR
jgi:hypothetical protein